MRSVPTLHAPTAASILLVDDNQDGVIARRSVLEELGYTVITARSGAAALALIERRQFDLVITDYKMPEMDGLAFIAALRQQHFNKPIILLTGFADKLGLSETTTGADLVLQKSSNEISALLRSTRRLLAPPRKGSLQPPASIVRQRKRSACLKAV